MVIKKNQRGFSQIEALLIVVVIAIVGLIGCYVYGVRNHSPSTSPTSTTTTTNTTGNGSTVTFSGKISDINNRCNVDGTCSITVAGKSVITGGGLSPNAADNTYGNLGGSGNSNFSVGQAVSVRALKSKNGYTLQACPDCYVK